MITGGPFERQLLGSIERSTAPLMHLLTNYPSSALCSAAVDEINRLIRDNFDFWVDQYGVASQPIESKAIALLIRQYEAVAGALPHELRARALMGAAHAWARLARFTEARRLYSAVIAAFPDHTQARERLERLPQ